MQNQIVHESISEMKKYAKALQGNRNYVAKKTAEDPDYFRKLSQGQNPKYLLIGCSDSRAPPNEITETDPGEIFIHRNIANVVVPTDLNINCVIQYAIEHLKVHNIVIMGHTFCGGVKAAMKQDSVGGLLDLWLNNLKLVYEKHQELINQLEDEDDRVACLAHMNVREQVLNVWKNPIVQKSWQDGHPVMVHGWLFRVETGFIEELEIEESIPTNLSKVFQLNFKPTQSQKPKQQKEDNEEERSRSPSIRKRFQRMQSRLETEIKRLTIITLQDPNQDVEKGVIDQVSEVLQKDPEFKTEDH
ncbi:unnamed protein product [Paramecium octaurelia]|uniref:Carbonic anhydrase n=1 Tax=Paramecium octaurelia TaxID=43137 RepID=A0A8S1WR21_PAROT|nr:unnamed protein product [Paramecium octaurelia]